MKAIKHICAFRFRDEIPEAARQQMLDELQTFPGRFPSMKRWTLNRNISRRDDRFSHAFVVEFDSEAELLAYLNSASHEAFVKERFRPLISERGIVTLEVAD